MPPPSAPVPRAAPMSRSKAAPKSSFAIAPPKKAKRKCEKEEEKKKEERADKKIYNASDEVADYDDLIEEAEMEDADDCFGGAPPPPPPSDAFGGAPPPPSCTTSSDATIMAPPLSTQPDESLAQILMLQKANGVWTEASLVLHFCTLCLCFTVVDERSKCCCCYGCYANQS